MQVPIQKAPSLEECKEFDGRYKRKIAAKPSLIYV